MGLFVSMCVVVGPACYFTFEGRAARSDCFAVITSDEQDSTAGTIAISQQHIIKAVIRNYSGKGAKERARAG
jgi:hypothetical protein